MMSLSGFVVVGLLVVSANLVAGHEHNRTGPAWEERRNEMTKGKDILDWSRDPRRVDPKVYDSSESETFVRRYSWVYAITGQLEGQELPAGLVGGDKIEPKSKGQTAVCGRQMSGPLWLACFDRLTDKYLDYLTHNGLLLERDLPMSKWTEVDCPPNRKSCITYKLDKPMLAERLEGEISGEFSTTIERVLRDYGPVMAETYMDVHGADIDKNCFFRRCSMTIAELEHNVLLVGYGITDDGVKYFKYKNSLGPEWGHNGYGYIKYGMGNTRKCSTEVVIRLWKIKACKGARARKSRHSRMHG